MRIKRLRCVHYRNLSDAELFPGEEMNVIYGENAQGKTNLLEAIWMFTGAKSFRSSKESSFLQFNESQAHCELEFISHDILHSGNIEYEEKRTAQLDGKKLANPAKMAGVFTAVIFSPYDLALVKDGPAKRRKFLDVAIGQLYPSYIEILRGYVRAVAQRNQVIKQYKYDGSLSVMLDVFEEEIAEKGKKLIQFRRDYVKKLAKFLPSIYEGLSQQKEKIDIQYLTGCQEQTLRETLHESRKTDCFTGVTSVGPHRDELELLLNDISVKQYGSQGQKRSVALALKLAQGEVINELFGEYPVCLLDDVMSELDPSRQHYILNHIKGRQSFITCCDPSNTKGLIEGKLFTVKDGNVKECM